MEENLHAQTAVPENEEGSTHQENETVVEEIPSSSSEQQEEVHNDMPVVEAASEETFTQTLESTPEQTIPKRGFLARLFGRK